MRGWGRRRGGPERPAWQRAARKLPSATALPFCAGADVGVDVGGDLDAARDALLFGQLQASSAFCNLVGGGAGTARPACVSLHARHTPAALQHTPHPACPPSQADPSCHPSHHPIQVTNSDLFEEEAADGALANNGTAPIGCGLGAAGGQGLSDLVAALGIAVPEGGAAIQGMGVKTPTGSWVVLARLGEGAERAEHAALGWGGTGC